MSRPRLTIGTFGEITTRKVASGRFESRTCYRDWDGRARQVAASGATARAAEHALKAKLAEHALKAKLAERSRPRHPQSGQPVPRPGRVLAGGHRPGGPHLEDHPQPL